MAGFPIFPRACADATRCLLSLLCNWRICHFIGKKNLINTGTAYHDAKSSTIPIAIPPNAVMKGWEKVKKFNLLLNVIAPIFSSAFAAFSRTAGSLSFSAFISGVTALLAEGPILPRDSAAAVLTFTSVSDKAFARAGTASLASAPILPRASMAVLRASLSPNAAIRAGTTSGVAARLASVPVRIACSAKTRLSVQWRSRRASASR